MGIDPALAGGAVLAGVFVGDRASPVSSGAILVSEITGTNLYDNVSAMLRRGLVPALLTCILYTMLGRSSGARAEVDLDTVFQTEFYLSWVLLLPLILIPVLSLLRLNVKQGETVRICCEGDAEAEAAQALEALMRAQF